MRVLDTLDLVEFVSLAVIEAPFHASTGCISNIPQAFRSEIGGHFHDRSAKSEVIYSLRWRFRTVRSSSDCCSRINSSRNSSSVGSTSL